MTSTRFVLFAALLLAACAGSPDAEETTQLPPPSLEKIADGVWLHKSYEIIKPWGPVLSQGLVVNTGDSIALIDTAWTDADTSRLLDDIERQLGDQPEIAIITHAHADKMGGVGALQERRIGGRAHPLTNEDAPVRGLKKTMFTILNDKDRESLLGVSEDGVATDGPLIAYYPGPGHTRDNIVVYYAAAKVLFGGCLIRPGNASNLGNTADGDVGHWAEAVRKVAEAFPDAEIVIPSHGAPGGRELLDHTIALAEAAAKEKP